MAFLQQIFFMITSLIILHTIPSTTSVVGPDQPTMILIDSICIDTVNMYECEQMIISKLANPHTEMLTLAKIAAINAAIISKETIGIIRDDYLPKAGIPLVKAQLQTCLVAYKGVEKLLEEAYTALLQNKYSEMRRSQSSVIPLFNNCVSDFDLMIHTNWRVKLWINISILAGRKLPAL
ncbi:hypothetical protein V5N11_016212 [Cardamine amara subsp. amara]|uniref:Pectinesterase inhibitor domain-containing protein n=1 Tax=Cardamine amara subsp. amara TaxID=228776 RepID=A0ABD1BVR5_CARAN